MPVRVEVCIQENYIEIFPPHLEGKLTASGEEYSIIKNIFKFDIVMGGHSFLLSVLCPSTAYKLAKKKKSGIRIHLVDDTSMIGRCFYPFEKLEEFAKDFRLTEISENKEG